MPSVLSAPWQACWRKRCVRANSRPARTPPHPPVAIPEADGFRHIPQRACGRPRATGSGAGPPANSGEVIREGHQGRSSARTSAPHALSAVIRGQQRSSGEVISAHLEHRDRLRILALMIGNQAQSSAITSSTATAFAYSPNSTHDLAIRVYALHSVGSSFTARSQSARHAA